MSTNNRTILSACTLFVVRLILLIGRSVFGFDQFIFDLRLVSSPPYTLHCISIQGAIVLSTGILGLEQVVHFVLYSGIARGA